MSAKLTIEQMQVLAQERKGVCLSTVYVNGSTKLRWRCAEGHEWESTPTNVKHKRRWCPTCGGSFPLTIEHMQALAKKRRGACLSTTYVNAHTKLRWRCQEGHEWEAVPNSVKDQGTWCPTCAGHTRLTIADMRAIARDRGGACLSTAYVNARTKVRWRCRKGHEWQAVPDSIRRGTWCQLCASARARPERRLTIKQMQVLAKKRGGTCLSTKYVGSNAKLRWQCAEGHEWEAIPGSVKRGSWCLKCAGLAPLTLDEMQTLARERGGTCLSTAYINAYTKLRWKCDEGHAWEATPGSVKNGSWCETCAEGGSERIARDVFEQMFSTPFPKRRPKWLINSRGNQMELDGYSKTLSLGFEYQGVQHYKQTRSFHQGGQTLARQKRDDARKRTLCREHDVELIAIPYTVIPADMPTYIFRTVKKRGLKLSVIQPERIKVAQFVLPKKLREMQDIAQEHGGACLSSAYVNATTKLRWQCAKGHEWEATPTRVKNAGQWCATCSRAKRKLTIKQMQAVAKERGGQCLSKKYANTDTQLRWRCAEGHEWAAIPSSVKRGSWCPVCAGKLRGTIEQMLVLATERGGHCLSKKYVNSQAKLLWRCAEGHEWAAAPGKVKQGRWCPVCATKLKGLPRLTVEQMQVLAKKHGGQCLSNKYGGAHTKLRWQCAEGHEWEAAPTNMKLRVKRGYWCTKCPRVT